MSNDHSSNHTSARALGWGWPCFVALGLLIPALAGAQAPSGARLVLKSGLHSILAKHAFVLTVADVGVPLTPSRVTIEFLDRTGRRRAFTAADLLPDRPVSLKVTAPSGAVLDMLRAVVTIDAGDGSRPVAGLEDIDVDAFRVDSKPPCAPPSVGAGAEGNCDGWVVTRLTVGQAPVN